LLKLIDSDLVPWRNDPVEHQPRLPTFKHQHLTTLPVGKHRSRHIVTAVTPKDRKEIRSLLAAFIHNHQRRNLTKQNIVPNRTSSNHQ
jgi:hypothetical protein